MNIFEFARAKREKALESPDVAKEAGEPPKPTMTQAEFGKPDLSPEARARRQKALADALRKRSY